ncbi:DUF3888 domain-containing protein [Brevibacillus choshinensis]|uniref:DUF3888 domain-containing protein n=1 Tax=Brevibacillus choshinensis TaxID=54911 RepID=A0ABX7FTB4_BRECH|nr:DUF3888 domain-containing protein [Brevibacillus choshinensis]QRG68586.1 DUF3888 domain-containing protein [Brevibacillus choshinensis]
MKWIILCICLLGGVLAIPVEIDATSPQLVHQHMLLEDALIASLSPQIQEAITKHFGTLKQYWCVKILQIEKQQPGSYLFEVSLQFETFEGPHNPPKHLFTVKIKNDAGGWYLKDVTVRELSPDDHVNCRHPV